MSKEIGEDIVNSNVFSEEQLNAILDSHGYEEVVRNDIIKWEVGMSIAGIFVKCRKAGKGYLVDFLSLADKTGQTMGCPTILRNMLDSFEHGDKFAAKCTRMITTTNGDAYDFQVFKLKK